MLKISPSLQASLWLSEALEMGTIQCAWHVGGGLVKSRTNMTWTPSTSGASHLSEPGKQWVKHHRLTAVMSETSRVWWRWLREDSQTSFSGDLMLLPQPEEWERACGSGLLCVP